MLLDPRPITTRVNPVVENVITKGDKVLVVATIDGSLGPRPRFNLPSAL